MVMLIVSMLLAQGPATVTVLPMGPPFTTQAPAEPVPAGSRPVIVWDGQQYVIAWADARRGSLDGGASDLWVGSWLPGRPITARLLTSSPEVIGAFSMAVGTGADGGTRLVLLRSRRSGSFQSEFVSRTFSSFPQTHFEGTDERRVTNTLFSSAPLDLATTTNGRWVAAYRLTQADVGLITFDPERPGLGSIVTPAFPGTGLALAAFDGGLMLATRTGTGFATTPITPDGGLGMVTLANTSAPNPTHLALVGAPPVVLVRENTAELRLFGPLTASGWGTGPIWGVQASATTLAASAHAGGLVTGWQTNAGVVYRARSSTTLDGPVAGAGPFGWGVVSLASNGVRAASLERNGSQHLRARDLQITSSDVSPRDLEPLLAPAPQGAPALVWDDAVRGFLLTWDDREPPLGNPRVVRRHVFPAGPPTSPATVQWTLPVLGAQTLALTRLGDGGVVALARQFTSGPRLIDLDATRNLSSRTLSTANGAEFLSGGRAEIISWRDTSFEYLLASRGQPSSFPVEAPTCIPSVNGAFWAMGVDVATTGDVLLIRIPEIGSATTQTLTASLTPLGRVCLASQSSTSPTAQFAAAAHSSGDAHVFRVDAVGTISAPVVVQGVRGDPLLTPLGPGFLLATRLAPADALGVFWVDFGASPVVRQFPVDSTRDVQTFTLASAPDRSAAAVAWSAFDADAGAWVVSARVFLHDAGVPDAGVPDAGVGTVDAGLVDGGGMVADAGLEPRDAGPPDSDGGADDAGRNDAGVEVDGGIDEPTPMDGGFPSDAGEAGGPGMVRFVPVACGCQASEGAWLLPVAVALWWRRRAARPSPAPSPGA